MSCFDCFDSYDFTAMPPLQVVLLYRMIYHFFLFHIEYSAFALDKIPCCHYESNTKLTKPKKK